VCDTGLAAELAVAETTGCGVLEHGKRLTVFSIRQQKNGSIWVRAGWAEVNQDNSVNLHLDVLPIDGRLHVREASERGSQPGAH